MSGVEAAWERRGTGVGDTRERVMIGGQGKRGCGKREGVRKRDRDQARMTVQKLSACMDSRESTRK